MNDTNKQSGIARRAGIFLVTATASGFGLGYSPVASGTFGTLPGIPLAFFLFRLDLGLLANTLIALALIALAIPLCHAAERVFGQKDDGRIVADEFLTFPLCVLGLPVAEFPLLLAPAFLAHRFFDILKPPPAWQAQNIRGGAGIVLDDVASSLYALAFNHLLWFAARTFFLPG